MSVFSYHTVKISVFHSLRWKLFGFRLNHVPGLLHAEQMSAMKLGAHLLSPKRYLFTQIILFAQWDNTEFIDQFLTSHKLGKQLSTGWHVRLKLIRRWGSISKILVQADESVELNQQTPIVAVTLARMKFLQIPRFIKWGRPVEKLVRDHPGARLSFASIRFPNTISTFSIWNSVDDMTQMVFGNSNVSDPKRHIDAMKERERKDFHTEFSTMRFIPIAEYGIWNDKDNWCTQKFTN